MVWAKPVTEPISLLAKKVKIACIRQGCWDEKRITEKMGRGNILRQIDKQMGMVCFCALALRCDGAQKIEAHAHKESKEEAAEDRVAKARGSRMQSEEW